MRSIMADKLSSIKVEDAFSSTGHYATNSFSSNISIVKVKNEFMSEQGDGNNDTENCTRKIKMEEADAALEDVTNSSDQFANTSTFKKREDFGICFDLVKKIKVKVESGLGSEEEARVNDAETRMKEIKAEKANATLRDFSVSAASTPVCCRSGHSSDTIMLSKEEDLGKCLEEEAGSPQVDSALLAATKDKEVSVCRDKVLLESKMNSEVDESVETQGTSWVPAFASIADSQPVNSECKKIYNLQIDPSVCSNGKPFTCMYCPASYQKKSDLKRHAIIHSDERPFACTRCPSKFKCKAYLNRHLATHLNDSRSNKKQYVCVHCAARFPQKHGLKMHLAIHKSFICSHCPAGFVEKGKLKRHLSIHLGEKPFICAHCSASFTRKDSLKGHEAVHLREKPFTCAYCSAGFARKGTLQRHLLIHAGEKLFICAPCPTKFTLELSLTMHLANLSGDRSFVLIVKLGLPEKLL